MLIQHAMVNGRAVDVRLNHQIETLVERSDARLTPLPGEAVIDANGARLLPGLHDHHMHFRALAAALQSVACGPPQVQTEAELITTLTTQPGSRWLRGVGYTESVAGDIDRAWLDAVIPNRPVRIQHRTGKCWILNSAALAQLELNRKDTNPGIERRANGEPTGRLFRLDKWLAARLPHQAGLTHLDITALSQHLAQLGITGFTDTSAHNNQASSQWFNEQAVQGHLLQRVTLMGDRTLSHGHYKVLLDEDSLPDLDQLIRDTKACYNQGRPVAFHCVTATEMVFALAVLEGAGQHPQNRIEHGSLIAPALFEPLRASGVCVVTQPGFIGHRGDQYQRDVPQNEQADLYRMQSLLGAGIPVVCSSDAPYGPVNPWQVMHSAEHRLTPTGEVLGATERISFEAALSGYLSHADDPAGAARLVAVGAAADLVLLRELEAEPPQIVQTFVQGVPLLANDSL